MRRYEQYLLSQSGGFGTKRCERVAAAVFAGLLLAPMAASGGLIFPSLLSDTRNTARSFTKVSEEEADLLDIEFQDLLAQIVFEPAAQTGEQRPDEALRTAENMAEARRLWVDRVEGARQRTEFAPVLRAQKVVREATARRRLFCEARPEDTAPYGKRFHTPTPHGDAHTSVQEEPVDPFARSANRVHPEARNAGELSARQEWLRRMVLVEPEQNRVSSPKSGSTSAPGGMNPLLGGVSVRNAGADASSSLPVDVQEHLPLPVRFQFEEGSFRVAGPLHAQIPDRLSFTPDSVRSISTATLYIGPSHRLDPLMFSNLRAEYDWIVNEGDWILRGDQTRVFVHSGIRQEGRMSILDGALLAKTSGAIVNNGVLYIGNGASFVDATVINARSSDAWIYVDTGSTLTATRSFVTGERGGVTGTVIVRNGSHVQAGTDRRVDLVVGGRGTGILEANDSTVGVTGALIVGQGNGSRGEVRLLGNAALWAEDVILAEHVNATAELTMEDGSSISGRNLVVGSKGSATLSAIDSALEFSGSVMVSDHVHSESSIALDGSAFSVAGDVRMGTKNRATASFDAANGSQIEIGGNLAIGDHASAETRFAIESGSSAGIGGSVNVAASSALYVEQGEMNVGQSLNVLGALEASAATLSIAADLNLAANGSISGLNGTELIIGGNFYSGIADPARFDLTGTSVTFDSTTTTSHTLSVAGFDYGPSMEGYVDNFSLGALRLGSGQSLTLQDVNGLGGALYVRILYLADGLAQLVDLVTHGLNIYYDPTEPANAYLLGETHDLDIAWLIPIPEPASGLLVLLGFAALRAGRRKPAASCATGSIRLGRPSTFPHTRRDARV